MALSIVSNQAASIATRQLGQSNDAATATAEKLSSGKRINSAKDDAAASAIAARLTAEVAGLQQAGVNAGQASSLLQIADGAFQNVEDILTRAKSLSVQAGSDQISDSERAFLDQEFQALKEEIDRISSDTEFNGTKLVNGDVKTNNAATSNIMTSVAAGGIAGVTFSTTGGSTAALTQVMGTNLSGVLDGIKTTGGGSGRVANTSGLMLAAPVTNTAAIAAGTTGVVGGFNADLTDNSGNAVPGFQGIGFNGVDLGNSMTLTQTVGGGKIEDTIRVAEANFNSNAMAASGTAAGIATAMVTFSATAGVMTSGGGTAAKAFSFMTTLSIAANGAQQSATALDGAFKLSLATDGTNGVMATFNPQEPLTIAAVATGDSFDGSVTIMLTGAFSNMNDPANGAGNSVSTNRVQNLLATGQENKDFTFKVGTGVSETEDEIQVSIGGIGTSALNIEDANLRDRAAANAASVQVSDAIDALQEKRSTVGAAQNRLDFAAQNVELTRENQEAARSELEDLNVAKAITEFSQQQLLVQAGTSTLSQANSLPQNLLQLFR